MRRFYLVSSNGNVAAEGVSFSPDQHTICWVANNSLVRLDAGHAYVVSTSELDELIQSLAMHIDWLDAVDVPFPRQKGPEAQR
jgi:hypothetical protein